MPGIKMEDLDDVESIDPAGKIRILQNALNENMSVAELIGASVIPVIRLDDLGVFLDGSITGVFIDLSPEVGCNSIGHGLGSGQRVQFSGTPYDTGTHEIIVTSPDEFKFTATFTGGGMTGTWASLKRQAKTGNFLYRINKPLSLDAPIVWSPTFGNFQNVVIETPHPLINAITANYTDLTLGAPFQGKGLFSFSTVNFQLNANTTLRDADIRSMDLEFVDFGFVIFDGHLTIDLAGPLIKNAAVTFKNRVTTSLFNVGMKLIDCGAISSSGAIFTPNPALSTPVIEVDDPTKVVSANFNGIDIGSLATGKSAILIPSGLQAASRIIVTGASVPADADLFDPAGLDETDPRVFANNNLGHKDTMFDAESRTNGRLVVPGAVVGTAVPIQTSSPSPGDYIIDPLTQNFSGDTSTGVNTYLSTKRTFDISYQITVDADTGPAQTLDIDIRINGDSQSKSIIQVVTGPVDVIFIGGLFELDLNDDIQLFKTNQTNTNASGITVDSFLIRRA